MGPLRLGLGLQGFLEAEVTEPPVGAEPWTVILQGPRWGPREAQGDRVTGALRGWVMSSLQDGALQCHAVPFIKNF